MPGKKTKNKNIREHIADSIGASKEILLDVSKLIIIGDREISVENYKGIVEYSENEVLISAKPKTIKISGNHIEISNMTKDILNIYGSFDSIKYETN